jgi:hypothetical protein
MRTLFLAATALLCAPYPARAQAGGEAAQVALTISLGAAPENRRDDADSPLAYAGSGPAVRIGYESVRATRRVYASIAAGWATLTPAKSLAGFEPQELFSAYSLTTGISWRLGGAPRGGGSSGDGSADAAAPRGGQFAFGVEFGATTTIGRHDYATTGLPQQNFVLGLATLGPAARWTQRVGAGEVAASLSLPVVALVDHPYADVRFARQLTNLHIAPLSQFHQMDGELSYAFRPASRLGITATYRLGAMQLNDVEPVRRVAQSLSIGVVRRFGVSR